MSILSKLRKRPKRSLYTPTISSTGQCTGIKCTQEHKDPTNDCLTCIAGFKLQGDNCIPDTTPPQPDQYECADIQCIDPLKDPTTDCTQCISNYTLVGNVCTPITPGCTNNASCTTSLGKLGKCVTGQCKCAEHSTKGVNEQCVCDTTYKLNLAGDACIAKTCADAGGPSCQSTLGNLSQCNNGTCECSSNSTIGTDGKCVCNNGYKTVGNACMAKTCKDDITICTSQLGNLSQCNNGTCECLANSTPGADGKCVCNNGYISDGTSCVLKDCTNTQNLCNDTTGPLSTCNSTDRKCVCKSNASLKGIGAMKKCKCDKGYLEDNENCIQETCANTSGYCKQDYGDLSQCVGGVCQCTANATKSGTGICQCDNGYLSLDGQTCVKKDCNNTPNLCKTTIGDISQCNSGTCECKPNASPQGPSNQCACNSEYKVNANNDCVLKNCTNTEGFCDSTFGTLSQCNSGNCQCVPHATKIGTGQCQCDSGYKPSGDGRSCIEVTFDCRADSNLCISYGSLGICDQTDGSCQCIANAGKPKGDSPCQCLQGFHQSGNACVPDTCANVPGLCKPEYGELSQCVGGVCQCTNNASKTPGNPCSCNSGYKPSDDGKSCVSNSCTITPSLCQSYGELGQCNGDGTCGCKANASGLPCKCDNGYYLLGGKCIKKPNCNDDDPQCPGYGDLGLCNADGTCSCIENAYRVFGECKCMFGYENVDGQCVKPQKTCKNTPNFCLEQYGTLYKCNDDGTCSCADNSHKPIFGGQCTCNDGYQLNKDGNACVLIPSCR